MKKLIQIFDRISLALALISGFVLVCLVILTFTDVTLRYVFSSPITGAQDLIAMGMVVVFFFALPLTSRVNGHIVVDLLPEFSNDRLNMLRDSFVKLLALAVFGLLAWEGAIRAEEAAMMGEATNMIEIPLRPFFYVLVAGCFLNAIILVIETLLLLGGERINDLEIEDEEKIDLSTANNHG
jgi:TRAP-type C4-dicarboxylate transport system permease small subunit